MRVLLTGGAGFVGRCVRRGLGAFEVAAPSHAELDIADPAAVERAVGALKPGAVIHAAAVSKPEQCEREPELARRVNREGTAAVARACARAGARLIFFSTDMVFDGKSPPYRETDPPAPAGVYPVGKADSERVIGDLLPDAVVLRQSLAYGWNRPREAFFSDWLYESLAAGKKLKLFSDQVRTMFYGEDIGRVLAAILKSGAAFPGGLYHLAGPERLSRYEYGLRFCRAFGFDEGLISPEPMPETDVPRPKDCSLDGSKLNAALGFSPTPVDEALARMKADRP